MDFKRLKPIYIFKKKVLGSCGFFAFCVITLVEIKIYTQLAHQNDHLYLSFVKKNICSWQKMARNGHKMAIYQLPFFCELAEVGCNLRLPFRP